MARLYTRALNSMLTAFKAGRFLALDSSDWECRSQGGGMGGQAWVSIECHGVSYFTKAL